MVGYETCEEPVMPAVRVLFPATLPLNRAPGLLVSIFSPVNCTVLETTWVLGNLERRTWTSRHLTCLCTVHRAAGPKRAHVADRLAVCQSPVGAETRRTTELCVGRSKGATASKGKPGSGRNPAGEHEALANGCRPYRSFTRAHRWPATSASAVWPVVRTTPPRMRRL